ncbi:MAG: hypothetical protein HDQ99_16795 [Lachnospiraceae bacterium]|nr:hypothetical protein [Lachnospiraceae bacterium]
MIFILMVISIALVWPLRLIRPMHYEGEIDENSMTIMLNEGTIMQGFAPLAGELSSISFYIYNEEPEAERQAGTLVFRLFDANLQKLEEKSYPIDTLEIPGVCCIRIGTDLQIGQVYYFTVENENAELLFSMEDGVNLDARYAYKAYFTKGQYALCALAVLLAGGFLIFLTEFLLRRDTRYVRADFGFRMALGVLVSGVVLWGLWNVFPGKKFTDNPADILLYIAGMLLFWFFALYSLFHRRQVSLEARISGEELLNRLRAALQSFAFAGVMLGGVRYLNALCLQEQKLASNLILACFAAAIICSYTKKEIFNWYNLVYLVLAVGCGIYYLQQYKEDLENWEIYKGNVLYFVLWGIVILNTVRILVWDRKGRNRVSWTYMIAVILLFAEMVRSRNGRTWPIDIAVFWGLFAIRVICKGGVQQYLAHFSDGVFIHFVGISVYAILYRPFHNFVYTRYPGVFHTVTMTAVYMVFVLVLAFIRFMEVYKKEKSLKAAYKEIWLVGMAADFLILTASRTGLFTALILCPLICIATTWLEFKDGIMGLTKRVLESIVVVVCFFPIVFTACRIVPAVVGRPFTYDIEWFQDSIRAGEEWDSFRYITLSRFLDIADGRISIKSENKADTQNEAEADPTKVFIEIPEVVKSPEEIEAEKWANANQYSSGRLEIYRLYLQNLNWKGHETVGLMTESGKDTGHAHDVFLQMAHDFGIGAGIYFIVFCVFAGVRSIFYYLKHKEESTALIPFGVLTVFCICGLVEWVFLPYIPTGFGFLFILVLMVPAEKNRDNRTDSLQEG